jgi:hypothetical protein
MVSTASRNEEVALSDKGVLYMHVVCPPMGKHVMP